MKKDRRDFLKLAGVTAAAGIGVTSGFQGLLGGEAEASGLKRAGAAKKKGGGERLGMVINIPKFAENQGLAERCIRRCHELHNVPEIGNSKDEVKWLWTDLFEQVFVKDTHPRQSERLHGLPVLSLCNHCDNPPCVRACPTKATFKKSDGVVGMDYHRCIGCRFCMAACPYGARSFNWRDPRPHVRNINPEYPARTAGVVEKCNFCTERLAVGKLPACVEEAAEFDAMIFGDLNDRDSKISRVLQETFTIQRRPSLGTYPSVFYII